MLMTGRGFEPLRQTSLGTHGAFTLNAPKATMWKNSNLCTKNSCGTRSVKT
jgi:hypothetical protein